MSESNDHENPPASRRARRIWGAVALALAAALFWAATSNEVYDLTSPPAFSFHVLLRKAYSIAAFALVGFTARKALGATALTPARGALLVAVYSAAIEIVQAIKGSHEGIAWNVVDVLCGAAGGWLGVVAGRIRRSRRRG
ncbi:MAG TPA: hypothetical protein VHS78_00060 [Candidatus Elarobacter sp.]|jgi:hypothetical protein|nr:hypothetical protein [Candidatus Elarobacter sp.]